MITWSLLPFLPINGRIERKCFHTKNFYFTSQTGKKIIVQKSNRYNKLPSLVFLIINRYFLVLESNRTQIMVINTYHSMIQILFSIYVKRLWFLFATNWSPHCDTIFLLSKKSKEKSFWCIHICHFLMPFERMRIHFLSCYYRDKMFQHKYWIQIAANFS